MLALTGAVHRLLFLATLRAECAKVLVPPDIRVRKHPSQERGRRGIQSSISGKNLLP